MRAHGHPRDDTVAVVLAGGRARRMGGGDKTLRLLAGRPLLAHVLDRIAPQVAEVVLSANGDAARFAAFGLAVVPDGLGDQPGPLAGVLAALDWVAIHRPGFPWLLSVTGDAPFLPRDLAARLHQATRQTGLTMACARSGGSGQVQPTIALWPVTVRAALRSALLAGTRRVEAFGAAQGCAHADWDAAVIDPFFNANTPDELAEAERLLPLAR